MPRKLAVGITPREAEVLRLVAAGISNKQIARRLRLSEYTVKRHLANARDKLGARDRTHAVVLAISVGVVLLDDCISG